MTAPAAQNGTNQNLAAAMNTLVALLLERPITERKQVLLAIGQAVLPPSTRT